MTNSSFLVVVVLSFDMELMDQISRMIPSFVVLDIGCGVFVGGIDDEDKREENKIIFTRWEFWRQVR
ncbi:hypothetical protein ISN44_As08g004290, partial [Arabidopsis suecica]